MVEVVSNVEEEVVVSLVLWWGNIALGVNGNGLKICIEVERFLSRIITRILRHDVKM